MNSVSLTFSKKYEIKYYEQNINGDLKESSLLNFLQDAATLSAESLGFGPTFVFSNNFAWVVLKYHIELFKPLRNLDSITIKTEPRGASRLYAFRDFAIYSQSEELLGRVCSTWALIDMASRRILSAQKVLPMMFPFEKQENELAYCKIEPFEKADLVKEFEVRFDDIDVNRHANNCNYIIWAFEALPVEFRLKRHIKTIDIKYRKEVGLNGKVLSEFAFDGSVSSHIIKDHSSGEELCALRVEWGD